MPAEVQRLQKEADAILENLNADNMMDQLNKRNLMILKINNLKKWMQPPSTADVQVDYRVVLERSFQ